MCVTVTQMTGYSVPRNQVLLTLANRRNESEVQKTYKNLQKRILSDNSAFIFYVNSQSSTFQCEKANYCDEPVPKNRFKPMTMDEEAVLMNNFEQRKVKCKKELVGLRLFKDATWGHFTDAHVDTHLISYADIFFISMLRMMGNFAAAFLCIASFLTTAILCIVAYYVTEWVLISIFVCNHP